jgi:signal transduction histidine kinase
MLGNVWEWCLDPWLMPAEDPRTSLNHRVIRGASWFYRDSEIRAGNRGFNEENDRNFDLGFRCCLEADPATNKMKRDDRACEKLVFREYLDETDKLLEQWLLSVGKTLKEFRTADEHGPVSPIQIATEVIRSLDTKSKTMGCKMQIESKMKDEESLVWGSANSIFEILEVLVVNALEARSRVVSIVCTIGTATSRMHNNNYVDLWVVDDGDGIAVEDYGNVKKPFFTSKNRSTGLGLAIADLLALDMGGSLELRSGGRAAGEDKTCWVVRLPLYVSANQRHHS